MIEDLAGRLQAAGFPDVSASFHPVFENIDPGGTRLTTLAARAAMTHQSMGEVVDALRERGYLERRPDPSDGRARLVCLTDEGSRLARRALREIAAIEDEWRSHFAEAGLDRDLRSVLEDAVRRAAAARAIPLIPDVVMPL
jgi:DNA-binding MarR family transcriptional regulator